MLCRQRGSGSRSPAWAASSAHLCCTPRRLETLQRFPAARIPPLPVQGLLAPAHEAYATSYAERKVATEETIQSGWLGTRHPGFCGDREMRERTTRVGEWVGWRGLLSLLPVHTNCSTHPPSWLTLTPTAPLIDSSPCGRPGAARRVCRRCHPGRCRDGARGGRHRRCGGEGGRTACCRGNPPVGGGGGRGKQGVSQCVCRVVLDGFGLGRKAGEGAWGCLPWQCLP